MIYIAIGRREKGKTTLAYRMLKNLPMRFVIDARRIVQPRDHQVIVENYVAGAADAMYEAIESNGQYNEVIYQPHEDRIDDAFAVWTKAIKNITIEFPHQRIGVLIDEASFYDLNDDTFQWLAKCTPRDTIHLFITAHRPTDIPPKIRSIADHWFVFHTTEKSDLDRIAEKSPEAADAASKLRDRGYVHWDDTIAALETNMNSRSWFISLNG